MKKIYRIKTLFRYCVLVFTLLFIQIINVEATEKATKQDDKVISLVEALENNRNFAGSKGWGHVELKMAQGDYGYSGQLLNTYFVGRTTGIIPKIPSEIEYSVLLIYTAYYLTKNTYNYLTDYMKNRQIIGDFNEGCFDFSNNILNTLSYDKNNNNAEIIKNFAATSEFKICALEDQDTKSDFIDNFAKHHIYIDTFNNGSVQIGNNNEEIFSLNLNTIERYNLDYNKTKINIAMTAGCIKPFEKYKYEYCCQNVYTNFDKCFDTYDNREIKHLIQKIYNIFISKPKRCYNMTIEDNQNNELCVCNS